MACTNGSPFIGLSERTKVKYPKSEHAQNWDRNLDSHKKLLLPISFIMMLMYSYSLYTTN